MKRRVLFVIDSLTCGGAERSLVSLLPLLDSGRIEADLLIVRRGGMFESSLPKSVRIVEMPRAEGLRRLLHPLCRLCFGVVLRLLRAAGGRRHAAELHWRIMHASVAPLGERYDAAVAYHQGFPTYYVAEKVSAAKKYAWVNIDLRGAGYSERFNRRFYDMYDGIAAVSESLRMMLLRTEYAESSKLRTVYDILDADTIGRMASEEVFVDDVPSETLKLTTVGRMTPQKNYALAVETARLLRERGMAFHWYFVGGGSEFESVSALVGRYGLGEYITMTDMQPNPYPYMACCDIYVQTSLFEGYCLTLREARMLHKPVVSTDFPVVHDQICDGVNGLVAEMTAESLAEKIAMLAENPALRESLVAATRTERDNTAATEAAKVSEMLLE